MVYWDHRQRRTTCRAQPNRSGESGLQMLPNIMQRVRYMIGRLKKRSARIGVFCVEDLIGADPEELYIRDAAAGGRLSDRCVLYVFRCAVYFANNTDYDPETLKWWNWKD